MKKSSILVLIFKPIEHMHMGHFRHLNAGLAHLRVSKDKQRNMANTQKV